MHQSAGTLCLKAMHLKLLILLLITYMTLKETES